MSDLTERQKEIIKAALNLISEGGLQALTMKNLANSLGITEPALYRHFENKHDILRNVLSFFRNKTEEIFNDAIKLDSSPIQKIEQVFMRHFEVFSENPAIAVILFSEGIFQLDDRLLEQVKSLMELSRGKLIELIEEGQRGGIIRKDVPSDALALLLMGSLRLQALRWRLELFSFDLKKEGKRLWKSLEKIIREKE